MAISCNLRLSFLQARYTCSESHRLLQGIFSYIMVDMTLESNSPRLLGTGDIWAGNHPDEYAEEVRQAQHRITVAQEKVARGEIVSPDELDLRTTREQLNELDT